MYDVVIVGSGPSGASTAYFLAGKGMNVALVERMDSNFDRYHRICGAGVSSKGTKHLGLKPDEILNKVDVLRMVWPGDKTLDIKIDGYVLDRPKLLRRLREESGAEVLHGTVIDIAQGDESCTVYLKDGRELVSRYVVGADGAHSTVRKCVFRTVPPHMMKVEEIHSDRKVEEGVFRFVIGRKYADAYQWYFPSGEGCSTGSKYGYAEPEPDGERGVRTIPFGWVPEVVKGNVMLVGDAAGMPNPVTYGGLRIAFEAAEHCAETILSDDPGRYSVWCSKSPLFDRRFMNVREKFIELSDEELLEISDRAVHHNLYLNGVDLIVHHPGIAWFYCGILMCIYNGW